MNVLFQINYFNKSWVREEVCARVVMNFPPEELPAVGDVIILNFNYPVLGSPIVRKRTFLGMGMRNFPYNWVIECKVDSPHLIKLAKSHGGDCGWYGEKEGGDIWPSC